MEQVSDAEVRYSYDDEQKFPEPKPQLGSRSLQPSGQSVRSQSGDSSSEVLSSPPLSQRQASVASFTSIQDLVEKYKQPAFEQEALKKAKDVVEAFFKRQNKSEALTRGLFPLVLLNNREITRFFINALTSAIEKSGLGEPAWYEVLVQTLAYDLVKEVLKPQDLVDMLNILRTKLDTLHVSEDEKELPELSAILSVLEIMAEKGVSGISKTKIKDPAYQSIDRFSSKGRSIEIRYLVSCCKQAFTKIKSNEKKGQMVRRKVGRTLSSLTRTGLLGFRIGTGALLPDIILSLADAGWGGIGDIPNIKKAFEEVFHTKKSSQAWYERAAQLDEAFAIVRNKEGLFEELLNHLKTKIKWSNYDWELSYSLVKNLQNVALNDKEPLNQTKALETLKLMFRNKAQWGEKPEMREGVLQALMEINEQGKAQEAHQACEILKELRKDYLNKVDRTNHPTESSQLVRKYLPEDAELESRHDQPRPGYRNSGRSASAVADSTEADELLRSIQQQQEDRASLQTIIRNQDSILKRLSSLSDLVAQISQQTAQESHERYDALRTQISELQATLTLRPVDEEILSRLQTLTESLQTVSLETTALQASLRAEIQQCTQEIQALRQAAQTEPQISSNIFNVPSLPEDFTGREEDLKTLHHLLQQHSLGAITQGAITGLGGIGKSTLAKAYAHHYGQEYELIWWFRAEEDIDSQYQELGKRMGLKVSDLKSVEAAKEVCWALSQQSWPSCPQREGRWLLIFDNVNAPDLLRGQLPSSPQGGSGHVLVTSRNSHWSHPLTLSSLKETEAIELLEKIIQGEEKEQLQALAQELHCFPLALKQAASYIIASQCGLVNIPQYLERYRERKEQLVSPDGPSDYLEEKGSQEATLEAVLQLNFEAVQKENPKAMDLLKLCAYIGADAIPLELLKKWSQKANTDLVLCLKVLKKYSLFEFDRVTKTASIHRLVQKFAQEEVANQPVEELEKRFSKLEITSESSQEVKEEEDPKQQAQQKWIEEEVLDVVLGGFKYLYDDLATWLSAKAWVPHVQTVLAHAEKLGAKQKGLLGATHNNLGNLLQDQGKYDGAEFHLRKAHEIWEEAYANQPNHPALASSYGSLGTLLKAQGKYDGAEFYLRKALEIQKQAYANQPNHPDLATAHNNLGTLLKAQRNYEGAEVHFRKAHEIWKEAYANQPDHPTLAFAHLSLGILLSAQEKYEGDDGAEFHYRKALKIWEEAYANQSNHPNLAFAHLSLGNLLLAQEKYEGDNGAEFHYRKALEMWEVVYANHPNHPELAAAHNNLGRALQAQGKYEEAEFYYRKALKIGNEAYANQPNHPDLAQSHNNLGNLLQDQGKYSEEAEFHLRKALEIWKQAYANQPNHPELATAHNNLGSLLWARGKYEGDDGAEFHLRKALEIKKEAYANHPNHLNLATAHNNLGSLLQAQRNYEGAEVHFRKALEMWEVVYAHQPNHSHLASVHSSLGDVLLAQGKLEEAQEHHQKALEIKEKAQISEESHPSEKGSFASRRKWRRMGSGLAAIGVAATLAAFWSRGKGK